MTLAIVTAGLYISGALLMQHGGGPRILGEISLLATILFLLALWLTLRLARRISRSEEP